MKTILSKSFFVVCYLALVNTRPQHGNNNNEIKGFKGIKMNKPNHLAMTKAKLPKGLPRNIDIDNYGTSAAADADMYQGDIKLTATQMKNMVRYLFDFCLDFNRIQYIDVLYLYVEKPRSCFGRCYYFYQMA